MVFGGTVFRPKGFGLLAASKNRTLKTAPLKPHPKKCTPKYAQKRAFFENRTPKLRLNN